MTSVGGGGGGDEINHSTVSFSKHHHKFKKRSVEDELRGKETYESMLP